MDLTVWPQVYLSSLILSLPLCKMGRWHFSVCVIVFTAKTLLQVKRKTK